MSITWQVIELSDTAFGPIAGKVVETDDDCFGPVDAVAAAYEIPVNQFERTTRTYARFLAIRNPTADFATPLAFFVRRFGGISGL